MNSFHITRKNVTPIIFNIFIVFYLAVNTFSQSQSLDETGSENISSRIILIGDAGESKGENDPILLALNNEASVVESTLVVILGDNIYPDGLVSEDHPDRMQALSYLDRQINAVIDANAQGLFIPGNHDWNNTDSDGWKQVKRQADYISKFNDKNITFEPLNGCPGPEVVDYGSNIRVIVLDTEWWLREEGERPEPEDKLCNHCDEKSIITALDSLLNISTDKFVILAAHHPLSTYGPHGGYFDLVDHIFPLTNLNEYLWIPLPIIGSLYPLVRGMGVSVQDISSSEYGNMKQQIESIVIKYPNVLVASGHEHALQVLKGPAGNYYLVSGAGVWGDVESVSNGDDTLFKGTYEGFMSLDYYDSNKIKLSVIRVVNKSGDREVVYSCWINN